ncbi:MAG TPA: hypothetical protein DDW50_12225 [Firmicutes bacterium]|jgi:pyruvate dehydrogenase E2 component (dihydrolipoamide acetyltransferase)|nr:hypothetical protein [Bacillota bacterium]
MKREISIKCQWLNTEETPAKVIRWLVAEGDHVEIDQDILVILLTEGEFVVPSPVDGMIQTIIAEPGEIIDPDQELAVIRID